MNILKSKADGLVICKTRLSASGKRQSDDQALYVFHADYEGLFLAEVEFPSEEEQREFAHTTAAWFGRDVTFSSDYHNSTLSKGRK